MKEANIISGPEEGNEGNINSDKKFEELKRQAARKQRAEKKQALRKYLKKNDPNLSITI